MGHSAAVSVASESTSHQRGRRAASHAAQGHTWTQQATTLSRTASIVLREGTCHRPATMRRRIVLSARWVDSPSNQAGRLSTTAHRAPTASFNRPLVPFHVLPAVPASSRHINEPTKCLLRASSVQRASIRMHRGPPHASTARWDSLLHRKDLINALIARPARVGY